MEAPGRHVGTDGRGATSRARAQVVEVLEKKMFGRSTVGDAVNPCTRRVRPPLWNCAPQWGWAVARYV